MRELDRRLNRLEAHINTDGHGCVVYTRPGESFEDACKRLGITDGGYIVIPEPVDAETWCRMAKEQQKELLAKTWTQ